ncbi:hypothetical protein PilKf_00791 [Pillotina sp. SPG140]|jgi:hypothetical protein
MIYAYEDTNPQYHGLLKVGYTTRDVETRVAEQYPTVRPGVPPYRIVVRKTAIRNDGSPFDDHEVHRKLKEKGFENPDGEWFLCTVADVEKAILSVKRSKPETH